MADYFTPTVIQQTIPEADVTPLERLLLSHVFEAERDGDGWYFFAETQPADTFIVARAALEAALAASQLDLDNTANSFVTKVLASLKDEELQDGNMDLDLSETSWEFIVQDIVRRSMTLKYVSAVSSFTCSRMRVDGFGGAVVVISADAILGKSTNDLLQEFIEQVSPGSVSCPIARRAKRRSLPGPPKEHLASRSDKRRRLPHARCLLRTRHPFTPPDQRCVVCCLGAAHRLSTGKPFPLRRKSLA